MFCLNLLLLATASWNSWNNNFFFFALFLCGKKTKDLCFEVSYWPKLLASRHEQVLTCLPRYSTMSKHQSIRKCKGLDKRNAMRNNKKHASDIYELKNISLALYCQKKGGVKMSVISLSEDFEIFCKFRHFSCVMQLISQTCPFLSELCQVLMTIFRFLHSQRCFTSCRRVSARPSFWRSSPAIWRTSSATRTTPRRARRRPPRRLGTKRRGRRGTESWANAELDSRCSPGRDSRNLLPTRPAVTKPSSGAEGGDTESHVNRCIYVPLLNVWPGPFSPLPDHLNKGLSDADVMGRARGVAVVVVVVRFFAATYIQFVCRRCGSFE